jgi:hypothetical protein
LQDYPYLEIPADIRDAFGIIRARIYGWLEEDLAPGDHGSGEDRTWLYATVNGFIGEAKDPLAAVPDSSTKPKVSMVVTTRTSLPDVLQARKASELDPLAAFYEYPQLPTVFPTAITTINEKLSHHVIAPLTPGEEIGIISVQAVETYCAAPTAKTAGIQGRTYPLLERLRHSRIPHS